MGRAASVFQPAGAAHLRPAADSPLNAPTEQSNAIAIRISIVPLSLIPRFAKVSDRLERPYRVSGVGMVISSQSLRDHARITSHLAPGPRGAGTRACRVETRLRTPDLVEFRLTQDCTLAGVPFPE